MTAIQRKGAAWALLPLLLCCGAADARAGGDGPGALAEVSGYRPALRDGDAVVFCFGEIDARGHGE